MSKHVQTPSAHVSRITHVTIRLISRYASILIALGKGDAVPMHYGDWLGSAIGDALGHPVKLTNISIDVLSLGASILTGLVCKSDQAKDIQADDEQFATASHARGTRGENPRRLRHKHSSSHVRSSDDDWQSNDDNNSGGNGSDASSTWLHSSTKLSARRALARRNLTSLAIAIGSLSTSRVRRGQSPKMSISESG